ncbi:MAG: hypothetical protein ACMUIU_12635 [bacterium]
MKNMLFIMALILAVVLTFTLFSENKTEAYYGGYGYGQPYYSGYGYGPPYGGYGYGQPYVGYGYSTYGGGIYGGYGGYGGYYGYAGLDVLGTERGIIIVPARMGEPNPQVPVDVSGGSSPEFNPPQNQTQPAPVNIFPPPVASVRTGQITYPVPVAYPQQGIMPPPGTGMATYPVYPPGPGPLWPDFSVIPSSPPMRPQPPFPPHPYWPIFYPMVPYLIPPWCILIPW